jgi:TM2 domain-containing membrane protein YozV
MNCYLHAEAPAVAYCRTCGRPLCEECRQTVQGTVYCQEHAPAAAPVQVAAPGSAVPAGGGSPVLAFVLGFIPGVGAIYNGQYAKGLIHAIITGLLITIAGSGGHDMGPVFGFAIVAWFLYMPFEAYHTARKRLAGKPVDEFSSLIDLRPSRSGFPTGAVVLIALGTILLLNTMDILRLRDVIRYWPVLLIAMGIYMLYMRMSAPPEGSAENER